MAMDPVKKAKREAAEREKIARLEMEEARIAKHMAEDQRKKQRIETQIVKEEKNLKKLGRS